MSFRLTDNTRETTTTTGTGPFTLGGAVAGSQAFATAGFIIGDTTWGTIRLSGSSWVTGLLTYSNTNEITVTTVLEGSSGAGVAVSFGAGTKDVFVDLPASKALGIPTTGDVKLTYKTTADRGWIICDDGSIGDGSSSATNRANADTLDLFTLLYTNIAALVVQDNTGSTVSRGANAAADFAAHRRLVIPKALGRSIAIAGAGSGLTSRTLGATAGAETETPTLAKTAAHTHTVPASAGTPGGFNNSAGTNNADGPNTSSSAGSGTALNILDPSTYLNIMIKL